MNEHTQYPIMLPFIFRLISSFQDELHEFFYQVLSDDLNCSAEDGSVEEVSLQTAISLPLPHCVLRFQN